MPQYVNDSTYDMSVCRCRILFGCFLIALHLLGQSVGMYLPLTGTCSVLNMWCNIISGGFLGAPAISSDSLHGRCPTSVISWRYSILIHWPSRWLNDAPWHSTDLPTFYHGYGQSVSSVSCDTCADEERTQFLVSKNTGKWFSRQLTITQWHCIWNMTG